MMRYSAFVGDGVNNPRTAFGLWYDHFTRRFLRITRGKINADLRYYTKMDLNRPSMEDVEDSVLDALRINLDMMREKYYDILRISNITDTMQLKDAYEVMSRMLIETRVRVYQKIEPLYDGNAKENGLAMILRVESFWGSPVDIYIKTYRFSEVHKSEDWWRDELNLMARLANK